MFPEGFVQENLVWAEPGDVVFDPFVGRGTTVFQSLLSNREAIGGDINPVAFCISRAKADPPTREQVLRRIDRLERAYLASSDTSAPPPELGRFFRLCFARGTLSQVLFLRGHLRWRHSRTDAFVAALCLGALHGESHRTDLCFSNRMPRTISTKPNYSVEWWTRNGFRPPRRDVFSILRALTLFRFSSEPPERRGVIVQSDVRTIGEALSAYHGRVGLMITSPPYIDTTDYREDQWLRIWFLRGRSYQKLRGRDDRHRTSSAYWKFLTEAWRGTAPLLRDSATVVIRIGGKSLDFDNAARELRKSLEQGLGRSIKQLEGRVNPIRRSQIHSFRPDAVPGKLEFDFRFRAG